MDLFSFAGKVMFEDLPSLVFDKAPKVLFEDLPKAIDKGLDKASGAIDEFLDK